MNPIRIEVPYNGQSFFIDIAEGNFVSLNKLHEFSGATKGKEPKEWVKLPSTKNVIESINWGKSPPFKSQARHWWWNLGALATSPILRTISFA